MNKNLYSMEDLIVFEVRNPETVLLLKKHFGGHGSIRRHRVTYIHPEEETGLPRLVVRLGSDIEETRKAAHSALGSIGINKDRLYAIGIYTRKGFFERSNPSLKKIAQS